MGNFAIPALRLVNQNIQKPVAASPLDIVRHLGAVQAQDFAAAKWAVGLRLKAATDDALGAAFDRGEILRTHILRPTWHFVAPEDIRWMLQLTAPRIHAASGTWYRKLELDAATFKRSEAAMSRALRGGCHLTRAELAAVLQQAGMTVGPGHMNLLMIHAELEGVVCSGARKGKQHTYALLEERAAQAKQLDRDAALAELARRYFTGHGPATLKDFIWWSGLGVVDARNGLEAVKAQLTCETVGENVYWFMPSQNRSLRKKQDVFLLPNFDEYTVGYADRSVISNESKTDGLVSRGNVIFENVVICNGQVIGTWKRDIGKERVRVMVKLHGEYSPELWAGIDTAAACYGQFLGLFATLEAA